jgi:hypothetical protein
MPTVEQSRVFWDTIRILQEAGALEHLVIIGSWGEYIYEQDGVLDGFTSTIRTRDVDFLIPNLRKPRTKMDMVSLLEANGFIVQQSSMSMQHRFFKPELEVEFLVREIGAGQAEPYDAPGFGIKVTGLRQMDLLSENLMRINLWGCEIQVPSPEAYVFHKLLIQRQTEEKAQKDLRAVENLLEYFRKHSDKVADLQKIYTKLTKKQQGRIADRCRENGIDLANMLELQV